MDLKQPGNQLYLVGQTRNELGGSHYSLIHDLQGGQVPVVDAAQARKTFAALHQAIRQGYVRACHDLSEGGLLVAAAEMVLAARCGAEMEIDAAPHQIEPPSMVRLALLLSESNSRFLCEIPVDAVGHFEKLMEGAPCAAIGQVTGNDRLTIRHAGHTIVSATVDELVDAWQSPLRWS
jgi:phosphoribosylformylglycinamidine synthase